MILKPVKNYGKQPAATLFKRFITKPKVNVVIGKYAEDDLADNYRNYDYYAVQIEGVLYGVYEINYDDLTYTKLSYVEGIQKLNNHECLIFTTLNTTAYDENVFITPIKVHATANPQDNYTDFYLNKDQYKGTLLSDYKGVLVDDTQKNQYYKFREFQYVAEDDVQHVEGQYIKGNTVHYRTMSIRWDTELDISKEDIIVIDNIPYEVGEIHESRRYAPRLVQTFRTELIERHV